MVITIKQCLRKITLLSAAVFYAAAAQSATLNIYEKNGAAEALSQAVKAFEKKYGCSVIVTEVPQNEHFSRVKALLDEGAALPDIYLLSSDELVEAVTGNMVEPLSFMDEQKVLYADAAINASSYEGKVYMAPRNVETMVVFFNRDKVSKLPAVFGGYDALAELMERSGEYGLIAQFDELKTDYGFLRAMGGNVFNVHKDGCYDYSKTWLNSQGGISALNSIVDYARAHVPPEIFKEDGANLMDELFINGKAAAVIADSSKFAVYHKSVPNLGVSELPKMKNGVTGAPFYQVTGGVVSSYSQNKELAESFLKFMSSSRYGIARYTSLNELSPIKGVIADKNVDSEFTEAVSTHFIVGDNLPDYKTMLLLEDIYKKYVSKVILDALGVKSALNSICKEYEKNSLDGLHTAPADESGQVSQKSE